MKKVLIYGDSNTWGDNFILGERIPDDKQWPNILQNFLGSEFKIIQEGLPGRLAGNDEKEKVYKNGKDSFIATFRTQAPVDVLIISLGTNDLQLKYNKDYMKIISDLAWYKDTIYEMFEDLDDRKKYFVNNKLPEIIYILPVNFDYIENAKVIFDINCEEKRNLIIQEFTKKVKDVETISFNDISLFDDGIHLDFNGHELMASVVKEKLLMGNNKKIELNEFNKRITLNVYGLENYCKDGPNIFIANHNCLMDIFYLPAALPNATINLISSRLIYKNEKSRKELVKNLLYSMPVEAHGGSKYSNMCLDYAKKLLYENIDLTIFPEGAYIQPSEYVYKGHTGIARILFSAREKGLHPNFIPVAIEIINGNDDLDSYIPNNEIVNVYILEPIDYESYYIEYINSQNTITRNNALHDVVDSGMKSIAKSLNKTFCNQYIELWPRNNIIFSDGNTVETSIAQDKYYVDLYDNELKKRFEGLLKEMKK